MHIGLIWALSSLGTKPAVAVCGSLSVLVGLVGIARLLASARNPILERKTSHRAPSAVGSTLLVAIGGSVLLCIGIIQPVATMSTRLTQSVYQQRKNTEVLERISRSQAEQTALSKALLDAYGDLAKRTGRMQTEQVTRAILSDPEHRDSKKLSRYEYKVWSQNGEDGIIAEIFRRIGATNRYFVEFGASNGLENNTALLVRQGWSGLWMDADTASVKIAKENFRSEIEGGKLTVLETFITAENIEDLFRQARVPEEIDLMSIDIDRNDYYVWEKITNYRPRVVIIEYNAVAPSTMSWVVPYDPKAFGWAKFGNLPHNGASLKALEELGAKKGYSLVGCDLCGVNAFFVRNDLLGTHFAEPYTAENHHEPFRFNYFSGLYPAVRFP
jgi:hypothetical protein